jgi:hypothetical protein
MKLLQRWPLILALAVAFTGSSTSLTSRAKSAEHNGVRVTAEEFTDRERCDKYFHLPDAHAEGLTILCVKVEDSHPSESLPNRYSGMHVIFDAAVIPMPSQSPCICGGMISSAVMVEENLVTDELRYDAIGSSRSAKGFAYYQPGKQRARLTPAESLPSPDLKPEVWDNTDHTSYRICLHRFENRTPSSCSKPPAPADPVLSSGSRLNFEPIPRCILVPAA